MGISGLHPVLKPYLRETHVSEYRGRRVGCDALAWLHRGACARADSLASSPPGQVTGAKPPPWLDFALNMVRMLLDNGVIPVVVFDGASLPAKAATQQARRERKREALEKAQQAAARGDQAEFRELISQTVDVTAEMAHELVNHLRAMGVEFLVAPYEADSQLAFLAGIHAGRGGVAAVITEDSDLVPCGCPRTLFKCDRSGCALELRLEDLFSGPPEPAAPDRGPQSAGAALSFRHFTLEMLQAVCVLAGCDFLPSVKGVGVHRAHKLVKRYRMLSRAVTLLKDDRRLSVPRDYLQSAQAAVRCFRHALVFDPSDGGGSQVRLAPLPSGVTDQWLETGHAPLVAKGVAYGFLHPTTHARFPAAHSMRTPEGARAGWMRTASKAFSPYTPSVRVSHPLTAQQKAATQPPVITLQEDHDENVNQQQLPAAWHGRASLASSITAALPLLTHSPAPWAQHQHQHTPAQPPSPATSSDIPSPSEGSRQYRRQLRPGSPARHLSGVQEASPGVVTGPLIGHHEAEAGQSARAPDDSAAMPRAVLFPSGAQTSQANGLAGHARSDIVGAASDLATAETGAEMLTAAPAPAPTAEYRSRAPPTCMSDADMTAAPRPGAALKTPRQDCAASTAPAAPVQTAKAPAERKKPKLWVGKCHRRPRHSQDSDQIEPHSAAQLHTHDSASPSKQAPAAGFSGINTEAAVASTRADDHSKQAAADAGLSSLISAVSETPSATHRSKPLGLQPDRTAQTQAGAASANLLRHGRMSSMTAADDDDDMLLQPTQLQPTVGNVPAATAGSGGHSQAYQQDQDACVMDDMQQDVDLTLATMAEPLSGAGPRPRQEVQEVQMGPQDFPGFKSAMDRSAVPSNSAPGDSLQLDVCFEGATQQKLPPADAAAVITIVAADSATDLSAGKTPATGRQQNAAAAAGRGSNAMHISPLWALVPADEAPAKARRASGSGGKKRGRASMGGSLAGQSSIQRFLLPAK